MSMKVRYQWTGDLREALAISVEKREKLWKKFPVVSHDTELRAKLWAEVADELTQQFGVLIDTDDMKKTWKNLKDNYWRITRLYENDPTKPRRWRFYQCMRFMDRANVDDSITLDGQSQNPSSSSDTPQTRLQKARMLIDGIAKRLRKEEYETQLSSSDGGGSGQEGSDSCGPQNSQGRVRDLIQISVPEIDRFIKTKQKPLTGAEIYCIPFEEIQDVLATKLKNIWTKLEDNHNEDQLDSQIDAIHVYQAENLISKPSDSNGGGMQHMVKYDKKMRTETDKETRLLELIEIANENYEINEEIRYTVQICASILRGVYHQAAFALFMRQNMPSGQLQTLVDAYDDYVYNNTKPMNKVISKVVKGCEPEKQKAFMALFSILERNTNLLSLKCPDDRWAEIDNEARKNIDKLFAKERAKKGSTSPALQFNTNLSKKHTRKRRKHVLTELGAEEQRRFMRMRAGIAKKLVEYVSAIESTKSLLEMVEPEDSETREELENTLRNVREMHDKTKNDQKRLEAQYKDFQNRSFGPRRKKRYVPESQSTAQDDAPVSTDNGSPEPDPQLFDHIVKLEPDA
ncbi:hypothetical protein COOONC_04671 [Cooperia oncophora]